MRHSDTRLFNMSFSMRKFLFSLRRRMSSSRSSVDNDLPSRSEAILSFQRYRILLAISSDLEASGTVQP
jgi:hypothetical protein